MVMGQVALALHGGAGARRRNDYGRERVHMRRCVALGRDRLLAGAAAIEVVTAVVAELEASGLYVAGRGASPNQVGDYELDAAVMDGSDRRAGAVAALVGFQSPIGVACGVMERTPHVMLSGTGAGRFAAREGFDRIADPAAWFTRAGGNEDNHPPGGLAHGTVGCVALDGDGRLAAATSTGGVFGKMAGRVGDAPLIGAGTWADGAAAVSCTGQGEYFIRVNAAAQAAWRVGMSGEALPAACDAVLGQIGAMGGNGGMIALDREGHIAMPYNSEGMKRAALHPDGRIEVAVFDDD